MSLTRSILAPNVSTTCLSRSSSRRRISSAATSTGLELRLRARLELDARRSEGMDLGPADLDGAALPPRLEDEADGLGIDLTQLDLEVGQRPENGPVRVEDLPAEDLGEEQEEVPARRLDLDNAVFGGHGPVSVYHFFSFPRIPKPMIDVAAKPMMIQKARGCLASGMADVHREGADDEGRHHDRRR